MTHAAPDEALRAFIDTLASIGEAIAVIRAGPISANLVGRIRIGADGDDASALRIAGCHCHLHVPWHQIADVIFRDIDVGYGDEPSIIFGDASGEPLLTLHFEPAATTRVRAAYLRFSGSQPVRIVSGDPPSIALVPVTDRRPSGPESADALLSLLGEVGLPIDFGRHGDWRSRNIAAIATRVALFQAAWRDPLVTHIWTGLGGYGSGLMIDALAAADIGPPAGAKTLVGASDVSQLAVWLAARHARVSYIHAFNFEDETLLAFRRDDLRTLLRLLGGEPVPNRRYQIDCWAGATGQCGGRAVPLNATAARSLAARGTDAHAVFDDAVLFLEDIGESLERVARIFDDLALLGVFERARAIALGLFLDDSETGHALLDPEQLLALVRARTGLPVFHFPEFGHGSARLPIVLGAPATFRPAGDHVEFELAFWPRCAS